MPDFILRAENLSKRYRIHPTVGQGWRHNQHVLVDDIMQVANKIRGRTSPGNKVTFWALKDVSFEARQGDVIGIIGRNGAGKSTLLKLLSRVTEPTSGRAIIYGRVGSLLEVGTGFHSELTGRENIFISGAIIGMSRAEIKRKFDEIVAFSEVGEFLDTPVKRFSSGMEVRLAFSVAAHLNPQVLLVDEVLSVGDASFQQKSLNKLKEVSENGGTILFVSHNMTTVASSCNQALVLEQGSVVFPLGPVTSAIDHYLTAIEQDHRFRLEEGRRGNSSGPVKISGFGIQDASGIIVDTLTSGMPIKFQIEYEMSQPGSLEDINCMIVIKTLKGDVIANLNSQTSAGSLKLLSPKGLIICDIAKLPIAPGNISIALSIEQNGQILDIINDAYVGAVDRGGHLEKRSHGERSGWLIIDQDWNLTVDKGEVI
jgi:lipopolysaccharide transport system ATP-binding protein